MFARYNFLHYLCIVKITQRNAITKERVGDCCVEDDFD